MRGRRCRRTVFVAITGSEVELEFEFELESGRYSTASEAVRSSKASTTLRICRAQQAQQGGGERERVGTL